MLTKLSVAGIKHRFKDYLVLLTGLIISSAVFYMFTNLATNKTFIKANTSIGMAAQVFVFGMVLLALITVVYISYANSFLLSMREHDYGLFMMLGAKKDRIGQLVFIETLLVGVLSTVIGIVLGMGMSIGLSSILFNQLGITVHHFSAIYGPAILTTLVLYVGLFLLSGLFNLTKLVRTPVLKLLHTDDEAYTPKRHPVIQTIEIVAGIVLLAVGYWAMSRIVSLQLLGVGLALVTITVGSYLLFNAVVISAIGFLKRTRFANQKLHNFTLAQIRFRVQGYTRILTIVSLLFALALGAISVGAGLQRQVPQMAKSTSAYTLAINDENAQEKSLIKKIKTSYAATYNQKMVGKVVYYDEQQFANQPLPLLKSRAPKNDGSVKALSLAKFKQVAPQDMDFIGLSPIYGSASAFATSTRFSQLHGQKHSVTVIRAQDMFGQRRLIERLHKLQVARFPVPETAAIGGYQTYKLFATLFGGLEFMGFFLGFAFLAMLASCLMFKILSGTRKDVVRYNMLNKIGASRQNMKSAVRGEVLTLFILPGVLGIVDVLFGLQMFKPLMYHPYAATGWSILIFCALYAVYYIVTILIYERIVVPKEQLEG